MWANHLPMTFRLRLTIAMDSRFQNNRNYKTATKDLDYHEDSDTIKPIPVVTKRI